MIRLSCFFFLFLLYTPVVAQGSKIADTSQVFIAMDIFLEPRDGMRGFKIRWLKYLKETMNEGQLKKTSYADHIFEVIVTKFGTLIENRTAKKETILCEFLRKEKSWGAGIRSGRPIAYLLKLKVPKELFGTENLEELLVRDDLIKQEFLK